MPKNTKSSASSATRKKKAAKAAKKGGGGDGNELTTSGDAADRGLQRGQKKEKGKKKEPKKKVYVPPVKPKAEIVDPLDSMGLASLLPADLVVLLRKASKKDVTTRIRALEGLLEWQQATQEDNEYVLGQEERKSSFIVALPSWAHLFPRLVASPNRRLRQLTVQAISAAMGVEDIRAEFVAQPALIEQIIGPLLVVAHGPDRLVSRMALNLFESLFRWSNEDHRDDTINLNDFISTLVDHLATLIFQNAGKSTVDVHSGENGRDGPAATTPIARDAKNRDDVQVEEDTEGTDGRLVAGSLGGLAWLIESECPKEEFERILPIISDTILWSALSLESGNEERSLGHLSPSVRISAWNLIKVLVAKWPQAFDTCLRAVGTSALFSAFQETDVLVAQSMREGLIRLLRLRPDTWKLADEEEADEDNDEGGSAAEDSSDEEGDGDGERVGDGLSVGHSLTSLSLAAFLQYLRAGVCGVPASYPMVILLLTTIPEDVLSTGSANSLDILHAIYAPIDERTAEGREMQRSLLSAFLECLVWLSGRVAARKSLKEACEVAKDVKTAWADLIGVAEVGGGSRRAISIADIGDERLSNELASCLRKLGNIDVELSLPMLELVRSAFDSYMTTSSTIPIELVTRILSKTVTQSQDVPKSAIVSRVRELVHDITFTTANIIASGDVTSQGITVLTLMLEHFAESQTSETVRVVRLAFEHLFSLEQSDLFSDQKAAFAVAFILSLSDETEQGKQWSSLLLTTVRKDGGVDWSLLRSVQSKLAETGALKTEERCHDLDDAVLRQYSANMAVSAQLIGRPYPILQADTVTRIVQSVVASKDVTKLPLVDAWLKADEGNASVLVSSNEMKAIVPDIYRSAAFSGDRHAKAVWTTIGKRDEAVQEAQGVLQDEILGLSRQLSIIHIEIQRSAIDWQTVLPTSTVMEQILGTTGDILPKPRLALSDGLVRLQDSPQQHELIYDEEGNSQVARIEITVLAAIQQQRQLRQAAFLPYLIDLSIAAEDALLEKGGGHSHFTATVPRVTLARQLEQCVSLSTSIIATQSSNLEVGWYDELVKQLQGQKSGDQADALQLAIRTVWSVCGADRILARLLKGCLSFSGAGSEEAGLLLRLAQVVQRDRPKQAYAIIAAVKDLVLELPLYDRLRNQAVADLAGVKSSEASTKGVELLNYAVALAPPLDSPLSLVPQQRAIFLLRTIQAWMASDDDLTTEVFVGLARIGVHLLPIVQDMPGSHLDLIIDVVEMNLDGASLDTDVAAVAAYHILALLGTLIALAERSAVLREVWKDRRPEILHSFQVFLFRLAPTDDQPFPSRARVQIEDMAADVMRSLPADKFKDNFEDLLKLLQIRTESDLPVVAYRVLAHTIRERVQEQIVENAVRSKRAEEEEEEEGEGDTGDAERRAERADAMSVALQARKLKQQLPSSLVQALGDGPDDNLLAYLLTWLTVFEFFEENTLDLRASYTSQLQNGHLVDGRLLPLLLSYLDPVKDQNKFALDEVFLDHLDGTDANCIETLTVHVFYRALIHTPTLVCDAFFAIKDKQQSSLLRSLTMRHLTPLLSRREFGHLREPGVLARLQDENMQIKVLANVSEVVATYTVDEYPLELAISMPSDYPLHPVEVRDLRKIGISEGTWRAWILGRRQLNAGRNGLIFAALLLFKRNVEAKFSGFDEDSTCSICYSIVSPTDHSLPTKPCKTCKKRFHASCLYKWVSTSGSSTCPLCRSIL